MHRFAILTIEITDLKQLVTMKLSTPKRGCVNHPDNFCYVCSDYTPLAHRVKLNSRISYAYKNYFACQVGDQDKKWAPHICCNRCRTSLLFWLDGKRKQMPFLVPTMWRKQSDHVTDYYFCMTNIGGFPRKKVQNFLPCVQARTQGGMHPPHQTERGVHMTLDFIENHRQNIFVRHIT